MNSEILKAGESFIHRTSRESSIQFLLPLFSPSLFCIHHNLSHSSRPRLFHQHLAPAIKHLLIFCRRTEVRSKTAEPKDRAATDQSDRRSRTQIRSRLTTLTIRRYQGYSLRFPSPFTLVSSSINKHFPPRTSLCRCVSTNPTPHRHGPKRPHPFARIYRKHQDLSTVDLTVLISVHRPSTIPCSHTLHPSANPSRQTPPCCHNSKHRSQAEAFSIGHPCHWNINLSISSTFALRKLRAPPLFGHKA